MSEKILNKKIKRPSWDKYFLSIAELVAERSTCLRRQVGAVIVKDKRILTTGYNGAPSGLDHCDKTGCLREKMNVPSGQRHELCRALHAEMNAILQAAQYGISLGGSIIYCTNQPCIICAKMIINAGIKRIVVLSSYPDEFARQFLKEADIEVVVAENK
ncbi:MAG: cytidine/deoxycytidylate deaminase family protein [Candidatus Omnitrophota bacterium]